MRNVGSIILIETAIAAGVVTEDEVSAIHTMALTPKPSYELLSQESAIPFITIKLLR